MKSAQPIDRWFSSSSLAWMTSVAALLAACSGSPSASSQQGAAAAVERGDAEDEPALGARAARGLAISPAPVATEGLSAQQRRMVGLGSYIVNAASDCSACHTGPAGFLSGGNPFFLDHSGHVVWTRNLTPAPRTGLQLTWEQFEEAIRTGHDFHPGETRMLVVMPWTTLRWASERDLAAIYAYLRAIPPIENEVPPDNKSDLPLPAEIPFPGSYTDGVVARALHGDHQSFDARRGREISPLVQPDDLGEGGKKAYGIGSYIANATAHCNDCHTHPDRTPDFAKVNTAAFLTGGTVFGVPPPLQPVFKNVRETSANLKGATHGFFNEPGDSFERFRAIITTGTHADETPPRPLGFPMVLVAGSLRNLTDDDLAALYSYVKHSPSTTGAADEPRQDYARWCATASDCGAGETCSAATSECVGRTCATDLDCDTCQTCGGGGTCQAPAPDSVCVLSAQ